MCYNFVKMVVFNNKATRGYKMRNKVLKIFVKADGVPEKCQGRYGECIKGSVGTFAMSIGIFVL